MKKEEDSRISKCSRRRFSWGCLPVGWPGSSWVEGTGGSGTSASVSAGASSGGWIFQALGASPEAGGFAMVVAFVGAVILIIAQRKVWPAQPAHA